MNGNDFFSIVAGDFDAVFMKEGIDVTVFKTIADGLSTFTFVSISEWLYKLRLISMIVTNVSQG